MVIGNFHSSCPLLQRYIKINAYKYPFPVYIRFPNRNHMRKKLTRCANSKRLFNDRTGIRCGSHQKPVLLQTYMRDTGELMHDLSVPIMVNGRHWGGIRLGYKPEP